MEAMAHQGTLWDPARAVLALDEERADDAARQAASIVKNIIWSRNAWTEAGEEEVGGSIRKVMRQTPESQEKANQAIRTLERAQAKKLRRLIVKPFA
jgi:hypothetical protein